MGFDDFVARAMENYNMLLLALTGRYLQLRTPGAEVTPRAVIDLERAVIALSATHYATAMSAIDLYLQKLLKDASEELVSALYQRKLHALALIRGMLAENVAQVVRLAKVGSSGLGSMLSAHGAMGLLVQRQAGAIQFRVADSSGRKWAAKVLMRTALRDFAYQSWIDFSLADVKRAGVDRFEVRYPDAARNITVSLADLTEKQRNLIFHVNSTALVESYVQT